MIKLFIDCARVEEAPTNGKWWVLHPNNGGVLATCHTEAEARAVRNIFDAMTRYFGSLDAAEVNK